MSDGPLSGFTPTEYAAGNIISPARIAIILSRKAICIDDLKRFVDLLKYDA